MPPILETKNCSMKFSGLTAVKEFSCALEPGHIYGLIGTNGAGKTTVINMLSGVLRPTTGEILFEGSASMALSRTASRGSESCAPIRTCACSTR